MRQKGKVLQIAVCEDEKEIREYIRSLLLKGLGAEGMESEIELFEDAETLISSETSPDILFLDIEMPGINGIQAAKRLREAGSQSVIIFVTAMEEYVFQVFDVGAFHYLVKPFRPEKFYEVLKKAVSVVQERRLFSAAKTAKERTIEIKNGRLHTQVILSNIVYAEVFNREILLHILSDNEPQNLKYYGRMKDLEKTAGENFFRIHRAYLINLGFVRSYEKEAVLVADQELPIARAAYPGFVKAFMRYQERR